MMLKKLIVMTGLISGVAQAAPSAYSNKCGTLHIDNPTKSTLLRDSEDCRTVWVLPPTAGISQLIGFTPSGNLLRCQAIKETEASRRELIQMIGKESLKSETWSKKVEEAEGKVFEAEREVTNYENNPIIKDIRNLQDEIEDLEDQTNELREKYYDCDENCGPIKAEIKELKTTRKKLRKDLRELKAHNRALYREYDKAQSGVKAALAHQKRVSSSFFRVAKAVGELKQVFEGFLAVDSKLEGGFSHLDYDLGWDEAVSTLEAIYGSSYEFKKVPTRNARINANFVGSASSGLYNSSLPVILDYTFAGLKYQPYGEERTAELSALPSRLSGSVRLSVIGACPLYYKNFLQSDSLQVADDLKTRKFNYSVTAEYEYPSLFNFKVNASYNLYKFYEKIKTSGSKGGFFRRKSYQSVVENKSDRDYFNITFLDEAEFYSKAEKDQIRKTIKSELMDRVLGTMAKPLYEKTPQLSVPNPKLGESGATVLAKGLRKTCGFNIYCQAGSWILSAADAIWGRTEAESRFKGTHDRRAEERWDLNEVKWRPASTGFSGL